MEEVGRRLLDAWVKWENAVKRKMNQVSALPDELDRLAQNLEALPKLILVDIAEE